MSDDALFADLAERLKTTNARLRSLDADAEVKAALAQRLIAITNASKHDLERAAERLDSLIAELDARG